MVQLAATNTLVQTNVDEDKLGRVMSLYGIAFFGGLAGALAFSAGVTASASP